ncbi:MAG: hypothetical protein IPM35_32130 [Myxococcales bacterium]|nr:hypothetical protein [Myxococcales bacterium]
MELTREQVPQFLAALRELHPAHYAMTYLGLATGLRPSSLRPLRRSGATPNVLWEQGRLLVRRSQTLGAVPLNTTKQKIRYTIDLPQEVLDVLAPQSDRDSGRHQAGDVDPRELRAWMADLVIRLRRAAAPGR